MSRIFLENNYKKYLQKKMEKFLCNRRSLNTHLFKSEDMKAQFVALGRK